MEGDLRNLATTQTVLHPTDRTTFIADIRLKAICLQNVPEEYHFERDPKDERYINLAIAARASYIVSRDTDLLNLMKLNSETALDFQRRFPLLRIITPADLLGEVKNK